MEDIILLTCTECSIPFEMLGWQFEVDIEEEGVGWEPCCPSCSGEELFFSQEYD